MKIFRRIVGVGLFLGVVLAFTACKAHPSESISLETVLPENSSGVVVFDYTDGDQVEKIEYLRSQFPETDMWGKLTTEWFGDGFAEKELSYEKDVAPIFEEEWKFGLSLTLPENLEDLDLASEEMPDDFDVFVVGKFSEADEAQALIETLLKRKVYIYKEDGDFQYWTMEDDRFYMARYGEIIFVTNAADNRDAAVARLKAGSGGFVVDKAKVGESNLGYVFVSGGVLFDAYQKFFGQLYEAIGLDEDLKNQFCSQMESFQQAKAG